MKSKNIIALILILLSVGIYYFGTTKYNVVCEGWNTINPLCLGSKILDFTLDVIIIILAVWTLLCGLIIMSIDEQKTIYALLLWIFLPITVINWFIPDILPFIDEIILSFISIILSLKTISPNKKIIESFSPF